MLGSRELSFLAACLTLALLAGASMALATEAERAAAKRCVPAPGQVTATEANNVEAIVDDSASMLESDPNRLRVAGLELLIDDPDNAGKTLGAVEFGGTAHTVFGPLTIGANRQFMVNRLRDGLTGDRFDTNYDAGFNRARMDNPDADAWIFLSDGEPDDGFSDSHRGGPRTFVVGLGIGGPNEGDPNANRLQRIADETAGVYFPDVEDDTLQATLKTISAAINCLPRPRQFKSRRFWRAGQERTRRVPVPRGRRELDLTLTWGDPANKFAITEVELVTARDRVLATLTGEGPPAKLRIERSRTRTSRSLRFAKPRGATRLVFTVKARRLVRPGFTIALLGER